MKTKALITVAVIIYISICISAVAMLLGIHASSTTDNDHIIQTPFRHEILVFSPLVTGKLGDHIYYTDNLFKNRKLSRSEKKEVTSFLQEADRNLDTDILVIGWSKSTIDDHLIFNACQYINGAAVPEVRYQTATSDHFEQTGNISPLSDLDTTNLTDLETLSEVIDKKVKEHSSDIFLEDKGQIYGTYNLEYDVSNGLYYSFRINEFSEIKADAGTGAIISEYYFNGEYVD